jgi:hypothetical protein
MDRNNVHAQAVVLFSLFVWHPCTGNTGCWVNKGRLHYPWHVCCAVCWPTQVELIVSDIKESVSRVSDVHFIAEDNMTVPSIAYEVGLSVYEHREKQACLCV